MDPSSCTVAHLGTVLPGLNFVPAGISTALVDFGAGMVLVSPVRTVVFWYAGSALGLSSTTINESAATTLVWPTSEFDPVDPLRPTAISA